MDRELNSKQKLGDLIANIGTIFINNRQKFPEAHAFASREGREFKYISWSKLVHDIFSFVSFLNEKNLKKSDRVIIISSNSYLRLVAEMGVMSSGLISVPIFAAYGQKLMSKIVEFSDAQMLIIEDGDKLDKIDPKVIPSKVVMLPHLPEILDATTTDQQKIKEQLEQVAADDLALIMYTSGTTNFPKGVMLTHKNILSQQKSLEILWDLKPNMRFLAYLPWHHSFGGLFERFLSLYSGGCLALDDSLGKDVDRLLNNFSQIKPHIYFSVPSVYQTIISNVVTQNKIKEIFFHPELKFVFTAAAPLPLSTSNVFKENKIPVVEGWGLTETSPCCTLTKMSLERTPGIVGFPLPEVEIKLSDECEIMVRGPNVMRGYFRRDDATNDVLDSNGWFKTGDVGEITEEGVRIISRKDRIFKLANAEKVFPVTIEEIIRKKCQFIQYIYIFGSGEQRPLALIFPNFDLLHAKNIKFTGCECPNSVGGFAGCFKNCLHEINENIEVKYQKIYRAIIINSSLTIEREELTPSMKLIPRTLEKKYAKYIECLKNGGAEKLAEMTKDAIMVTLGDKL